jgi:hypothetical protein
VVLRSYSGLACFTLKALALVQVLGRRDQLKNQYLCCQAKVACLDLLYLAGCGKLGGTAPDRDIGLDDDLYGTYLFGVRRGGIRQKHNTEAGALQQTGYDQSTKPASFGQSSEQDFWMTAPYSDTKGRN